MSYIIRKFTDWVGSTQGTVCGVGSIILCMLAGFPLHFSNGYQLAANYYMSVVSFILLFTIQNGSKHESKAIILKMNELINQ